ncbi:MAG: TraM recognition domain-containing protein [Chitinophagaceae bacterium]|nr:TraM recognition domain-containing protein [Chitinophagaceae bacterium]
MIPHYYPFLNALFVKATSVLETISSGRSNNIITVIALQDYSQLKLKYSKEEAEVIFNITGNVILIGTKESIEAGDLSPIGQ